MSQRQYAYHCTNTDPEIIKREGWKVGMGFTLGNFFDKLNKKYLPKVPVYVTSDTREVWDTNADYIIKLDITGLDLYPDFGSLPDTGAFYDLDGKYFHWYDDSGIGLTFTNTPAGKKMKEYLESISPDEYILLPDDFSGEDSMRILGTAVVDGRKLRGRIVSYTKKDDEMKIDENSKITLTVGQLKMLIEESAAYVPVRGNVIFHLEWQSDYDGEESYRHRPAAFEGIRDHLDDLADDYDFDDKTVDQLEKEIGYKSEHSLYGLRTGEYTHRFMSIEEAESFKQYCIDNIVRAGSWTKNVTISGDTLTWRGKATTSSWISPNGNGHSVEKWFTFKCRIYIENLD